MNNHIFQVRYRSIMCGTLALFGNYKNEEDAKVAASLLRSSFLSHGFFQEAKSVTVC